uniref:Putative licpodalin-4 1 n=1 Tax=Rhipicephalus microplus TaxID=6941 RepID=A0A6M2D3A3_RHIMP
MKATISIDLKSFGILLLAVTFALAETELLERQPRLSKYQDAWKALTVPGRYYLYMRSYKDEPFYGEDRKCVYNELISVNEEEKYTVNTMGSISVKDGAEKTQTIYAWTSTSEGYTEPNVIHASDSKDKVFSLEFPIAFSEYENCDILRVPHRNNACELWAKEGRIHEIKSLCFYVFHLLCGPEKYFVYNRDLCRSEKRHCP